MHTNFGVKKQWDPCCISVNMQLLQTLFIIKVRKHLLFFIPLCSVNAVKDDTSSKTIRIWLHDFVQGIALKAKQLRSKWRHHMVTPVINLVFFIIISKILDQIFYFGIKDKLWAFIPYLEILTSTCLGFNGRSCTLYTVQCTMYNVHCTMSYIEDVLNNLILSVNVQLIQHSSNTTFSFLLYGEG